MNHNDPNLDVETLRSRVLATPLTTLQLACKSVAPGPDPADLALLARARHLESVGHGRSAAASGDHVVTEICRRHPTTVIVRRGRPVAHGLRQAAIAVLAA